MTIEWLTIIVDNVFGYVLEQSGIGEYVRDKLKRDPAKKAFKRALGKAFERFKQKYPQQVADLFDADFLKKEGAPIISELLIRDGHPNPTELAARWAASLNHRYAEQAGHSTTLIRDMEPAAADLLSYLAEELKKESALEKLNDSRAFEKLASDVAAICHSLGADEATPGSRRDYLRWQIERNLYLNFRGTFQTQHHIHLKLDETYISLRAERRETTNPLERLRLEQELLALEKKIANSNDNHLPDEEIEDQHEQLLTRLIGETIELAEAINRQDRLVILGDPGCGKTTLLRYLALKHAQALMNGQNEAADGLGKARFPILIRIAAYAEKEVWRTKPLSEFLADYCYSQECPKPGLADLLRKEMDSGNCLILLDGLDEIVNSDHRQGVAERVENFVNQHHNNYSNHFIITSRVVGYRSAPLSGSFTHYTMQEMDIPQIQHFLERWCRAVEAAQKDISAELRESTVRRETDRIMEAVRTWPSVRRLAANPLLLCTMALIQQNYDRLPQKRIELYRRAADTLAISWRSAQGIPESELAFLKDWYLTPLLSKMAYWLHTNKPTGIATKQEVYDILSEEWARLNELPWNANKPNPKIQADVEKFLVAVREHTGIFLERAPDQYGFMHLAFQEYYAARYLVSMSEVRAKLIREHLHDPRWNEPILLALGFVGLEFPLEASKLLETAILAQGDGLKTLGLTPKPYEAYENILGLDYLFAIRCLGDDIPTSTKLMHKLVNRLTDELLDQSDSARFYRYREALKERLIYLKGSERASTILLSQLIEALDDPNRDICYHAVESLGELGASSPEIITRLLTFLRDDFAREAAARSLGKLRQPSPEVVTALIRALHNSSPTVRNTVAEALRQLGQISPLVVTALLNILQQQFSTPIYSIARETLRQLGRTSPEVIRVLLDSLDDTHMDVYVSVIRSLGKSSQVSREMINVLLNALQHPDTKVSTAAARSLGELRRPSPEVISALINILKSGKPGASGAAARSLGKLHQPTADVITALINALKRSKSLTVHKEVVSSLGELGYVSDDVIEALRACFDYQNPDGPLVREAAAKSLGKLGNASYKVISTLIEALSDKVPRVRIAAADTLGGLGESSSRVVKALIFTLRDGEEDQDVRRAAAENLERLSHLSTESEVLAELSKALRDTDPLVRLAAARSLSKLGLTDSSLTQQIERVLLNSLDHPQNWYRRRSVLLLGQFGQNDQTTIDKLLHGLLDADPTIRTACAQALAQLGWRFPNASEKIAKMLVQAINDPKFDKHDDLELRAHDYAYDALWMLIVGGVFEEV